MEIVNFGPNEVSAGKPFNVQPTGESAMWIKASRPVGPDSKIVIGETRLPTVISGDVLTAVVPVPLYSEAGQKHLTIEELRDGRWTMAKPSIWIVR